MKSNILSFVCLLGIFCFITSFRFEKEKSLNGVFGEKGMFEIQLQSDNTFVYYHFKNGTEIKTTGTWELLGEELKLKSDSAPKKMILSWKISASKNRLIAQKGTTTYMLYKKINCKF